MNRHIFNWKVILAIPILLLITLSSSAQQKASIKEYKKLFTTYPFSDPDPVPRVGRIYPYFRFDGYAEKPTGKEWKVVELENDYLKLLILPEIGGKVWAAIEKSTGKSFVYYNHVVKFRDVAMRGPWTSGGVEANYGIVGHTPNCATPVDYTVINKKDGSVSCVVGVLDLLTRTTWRVDINLPSDKAYFTTSSFWYNNTALEQPYYTWMNTGIKAKGNLEFIYPGTRYLGHSGEYADWPINKQNGKNISFYENNDFGGYKSYHVFGKYTDFFGGYWHDEDFGMGRYSTYDDKAGKKIWIWGLSQQGMIWEKLLSDTDGQYVEVQSGRFFNQAAEGSSLSPFKNRGFLPHTTDVWTEYWFPVLKTTGFVAANNYGALNIKKEGGWIKIYLSPLQQVTEDLKITNGDKVLYSKKISVKPLQLFADSIQVTTEANNLVATLGGDKLIYESSPEANVLARPIQSPSDFNWKSAYGLYLQGKEAMRMRNYVSAEDFLKQSLDKEPYFTPALTDYSMLQYRNGRYADALLTAKKALSIDTYDPAANFYYGIINAQLGNVADAKDGFSIAAMNAEYRSAAYTELAKIYLRERSLNKAAAYAKKSIQFNQYAVAAYQVLALVYRLQNNQGEAAKVLDTLLAYDPLHHFALFEKYSWQPTAENKSGFINLIRSELPAETFLELAINYEQMGFKKEAQTLLSWAPSNAEVLYWQAYLGNTLLDLKALKPDAVFPFRSETAVVLENLLSKQDHWLLKYHLALIEWHHNNTDRAKKLFEEIGEVPVYVPFYAARAELFREDSTKALADLQKAATLDPKQWRYGQSLVLYHLVHKEKGKALTLANKYYKQHPDNYVLGMSYIKALMQNNRYAEASTVLQKINILPNEGATEGRQLYREAQLMLAMQELSKKNYAKALQLIEKAKEWPENLGVGKPYQEFIDERLEDWLAYEAYIKRGKNTEAKNILAKIKSFTPKTEEGTRYYSANDLISAWALQKQGNNGAKLLEDWKAKEPNSALLTWVRNVYENGSIADSVIPNDNNSRLLLQWLRSSEAR